MTESFVLTSPDAVTWTSQSVGVSAPGALSSVCFGSGTFVAVGSGGIPNIWSSPDGTNWNAQGPAGLAFDLGLEYLDAVAYGNGEFVAVGPASDAFRSFEPILTSPDGANWTTNQVPWIGLLYGIDVLDGAFAVTGMEAGPAAQNGNYFGPLQRFLFGLRLRRPFTGD